MIQITAGNRYNSGYAAGASDKVTLIYKSYTWTINVVNGWDGTVQTFSLDFPTTALGIQNIDHNYYQPFIHAAAVEGNNLRISFCNYTGADHTVTFTIYMYGY